MINFCPVSDIWMIYSFLNSKRHQKKMNKNLLKRNEAVI